MSGLRLTTPRATDRVRCARCGRDVALGLCHQCGTPICTICRTQSLPDRWAARLNAFLFDDQLVRCHQHPPPPYALWAVLGGSLLLFGAFVALIVWGRVVGSLVGVVALGAMLAALLAIYRYQPPAPRIEPALEPALGAVEDYRYHLDLPAGTAQDARALLRVRDRRRRAPTLVTQLSSAGATRFHQGGLLLATGPEPTALAQPLVADGPWSLLFTASGAELAATEGAWAPVEIDLDTAPLPLRLSTGWEAEGGRRTLHLELTLLPPFDRHPAHLRRLTVVIPPHWPPLRPDPEARLETLADGRQQLTISDRAFPIVAQTGAEQPPTGPTALATLRVALRWERDLGESGIGSHPLAAEVQGEAVVTLQGSASGLLLSWWSASGMMPQPLALTSQLAVSFTIHTDTLPASYRDTLRWPVAHLLPLPPTPELADALTDALRQHLAPLGPQSALVRVEEHPTHRSLHDSRLEVRQWTFWGRVYSGLIPVIFRLFLQGEAPRPGATPASTPVADAWTTLHVSLGIESGQRDDYPDQLFLVDQALWAAIAQAEATLHQLPEWNA